MAVARPGRADPRPSRRPAGRRRGDRAVPRATASVAPDQRPGRRPRPRPTGCVFVPPQPHELLSTYYRAADVCLVPSRSESFGLVALEAAACGTPVVASDVGGLRSLVDHGRTGYLVEEPGPGGVRRLGPPDPGRAAAGRAPEHRRGAAGPPLHLGPCRPPAGRDLRRSHRRPPRRVLVTDRWGRHPRPRGAGGGLRRHRPLGRAGALGRGGAGGRATGSPVGIRSPAPRAGTCGCGARRRSSSPCG